MTRPNDQATTERREALPSPSLRLDAAARKAEERRKAKRPPQDFDTSALPLFGDQRHQLELF